MNRNTLRFSIAFLLFVCLCVAGFLAGYRAGYPDGYATGQAKRESEEPYPKVYEVGEIIRATEEAAGKNSDRIGMPDYQSLIDATQTSVFPDEWEALGGPCTMAPIPWLESLVVNATSGVHGRLNTFFGDLAAVRLAVASSREEQEKMRQAQQKWRSGMLEPASTSLAKELSPIDADIKLIGRWSVQQTRGDGLTSQLQYTFIDADTVQIGASNDPNDLVEAWYFVSPGSIVVSGNAYVAVTTEDGILVLIPNNEPQAFLVATRVVVEP